MPSNNSRTAAELLAAYHAKRAAAIRKLWAGLHDEACVRYGSGPLTSGIGNATAAPEIVRAENVDMAPVPGFAPMTARHVWLRIIGTLLTIEAGTAAALYLIDRICG